MTVRFEGWKAVPIASTVHSLTVLPARARTNESVASKLIGTFPHPKTNATIGQVAFSADGTRLFTSGYPSGIVQIWDVSTRKELRRIDTPPGYRSTWEYALPTEDWKTLFVPVDKRTTRIVEQNGKKVYRTDYAGDIRVWDLVTGKEKEPIQPAPGSAPDYGKLAPGGQFFLSAELSWDSLKNESKYVTVVRDLSSHTQWRCDGFAVPSFAPDGKTMLVRITDHGSNKSMIKLLQVATGTQLATLDCPEKKRSFSIRAISPDGAVAAINLGGKKGAPLEVWFRDARSLEDRGKLTGEGDPQRYGWNTGVFSTDSKRFITFDGQGKALVWDVASQRMDRILPSGADRAPLHLAISPDGKTLAAAWVPKSDEDEDSEDEPDPKDRPQPRLSLIDLASDTPPLVLVAPHGFAGALAFSPDGRTLAFGSSGAVHLFDLTR
jgi:WD40 repeat protein